MNNYFKIRKYGEYFEQLYKLAQEYWESEPGMTFDDGLDTSFVGDSDKHNAIRNKIVRLLPYVNEAADQLSGVKVFLVSLDFPDEFEKVNSFAKKRQLKPELYLLDEKDYDSYMLSKFNWTTQLLYH